MRNKMNHKKIRVKPSATVHTFQFTKTAPEAWRKTGNEIHTQQPVQVLKPWNDEGILDSGWWHQSPEIRSDAKVGNFAE
jgi:hypothetical protein